MMPVGCCLYSFPERDRRHPRQRAWRAVAGLNHREAALHSSARSTQCQETMMVGNPHQATVCSNRVVQRMLPVFLLLLASCGGSSNPSPPPPASPPPATP